MEKSEFVRLINMLSINEIKLLTLSKEVGFIKRTRKLDSLDFLYSLSMESIKGIASCNDIAAAIEEGNGTSVSRQAIWKKVTETCLGYFKLVLELVILGKITPRLGQNKILECKFTRVIVQDSTLIKLPERLFVLFSGVSNKSTSVCNARIQGIYDLVSGKFISFSINPYSKNDHSSAPEMELMKNDLTLRDRGYLSINEIKRHLQFGAHFIYRHKMKLLLLDPATGNPVDILKKLKKESKLDMLVMLNEEDNTIIRLVAHPVDKQTADKRRRKAKKEMKGHNPNKEFMELQSWTIFLTTLDANQADFNTLLEIYGLRWRIEIIFKSWKSNLHFDYIHNVSNTQLQLLIIARLIMILIITQFIYPIYRVIIFREMKKEISILKLTKYLNHNPGKLYSLLRDFIKYPNHLAESMKKLARYCVYDRRVRLNIMQKMEILSTLS
jgi:hypothetical protein